MVKCTLKSFVKKEEFLGLELTELRDYLVNKQGQNFYEVSLDLHVYEERAMSFDINMRRSKIKWEIIGIFEDEIEVGDGWKLYKSEPVERRELKKRFLRGWLEDQLWDTGSKTQTEYEPESLSAIEFSESKGHFFHEEHDRFSRDSVRRCWDCRGLKAKKWRSRPRLTDKKLSTGDGDTWHVYVNEKLALFYYDTKTPIKFYAESPYGAERMAAINFLKENETLHAAISNYIEWQRIMNIYNGTYKKNNCMAQIEQLYDDAGHCDKEIPEDIKNILRKIATTSRFCELGPTEQEAVTRAKNESAKVRLAFRLAQLNYIRLIKENDFQLLNHIKDAALRAKAWVEESIQIPQFRDPAYETRYSGSNDSASRIKENIPIFLLGRKFNDKFIKNGKMIFQKSGDELTLNFEARADSNVIAVHLELFRENGESVILTFDQFTKETGGSHLENKFKQILLTDFLPDRIKFLFTIVSDED